ncbi:uncharacterized [Tachysurus ichikawai]
MDLFSIVLKLWWFNGSFNSLVVYTTPNNETTPVSTTILNHKLCNIDVLATSITPDMMQESKSIDSILEKLQSS